MGGKEGLGRSSQCLKILNFFSLKFFPQKKFKIFKHWELRPRPSSPPHYLQIPGYAPPIVLRVVADLVFDKHYSNNTAKSYFTTYLLLFARTMILSFKTGYYAVTKILTDVLHKVFVQIDCDILQ